jgi:hypothetical protein
LVAVKELLVQAAVAWRQFGSESGDNITVIAISLQRQHAQQQQQRPPVKRPQAAVARPAPLSEAALRQQINEWTVGLAGGLLEGAPIRLATEIARVVNDGPNLHVLPIVTRGPTENVNDLLYLKGVDMAIIASDSLEEYKSQVPDIQRRLTH